MNDASATPGTATKIELDEPVARLVIDALRSVRFGTITLTIHNGRVTDVDTTQRNRVTPTK